MGNCDKTRSTVPLDCPGERAAPRYNFAAEVTAGGQPATAVGGGGGRLRPPCGDRVTCKCQILTQQVNVCRVHCRRRRAARHGDWRGGRDPPPALWRPGDLPVPDLDSTRSCHDLIGCAFPVGLSRATCRGRSANIRATTRLPVRVGRCRAAPRANSRH